MRVRALDMDHDWLFGKGQNDYLTQQSAIAQSIDTRLNSYLGDCFFDAEAGIDWFNLLGSKNQLALDKAVKLVITNTDEVTGLVEVSLNLVDTRRITLTYTVDTVYTRQFQASVGVSIG